MRGHVKLTVSLLNRVIRLPLYLYHPHTPPRGRGRAAAPPTTTTTMSSTLTVLLLFALAAARGATALQCGQVTQLMTPCMPYLAGAPGMTPYGLCCNSLGVLNQLAATAADRVAACNCVKAAAGGFPTVDFSRASGLPAACGISISFTISPNMDCNQVSTQEP